MDEWKKPSKLRILSIVIFIAFVSFLILYKPYEEFTIIVLPDTQLAVQDYPEFFQSQVDWIITNKEELNIKLVIHIGDVVQRPENHSQYQTALGQLSRIDIPMFIVPGNHDMLDYFPDGSEVQNGSDYSIFNQYFGDPNKVSTIKLDEEYLLVGLEFCPSDDVLSRADEIISQNKDKKVILVTHAYMGISGRSTINHPLNCGQAPERFEKDWNNGEDIYQELVKKHDNIFMVHSGHFFGQSRITDCRDEKPTHQILQNYQYLPNGGEGILRIYNFKEEEIMVQSYAPPWDQYLQDEANNFTLGYTC